jgi:hypothetical protein
MQKVIKIGVGYSSPVPIFNLGRIKKADENAFLAEHAGVKGKLTPEEKERKQYELCVDHLAKWSVERPTKKIENPDKKPGDDLPEIIEVPFFDDPEATAADDVRRIFQEAEDREEDIVRSADLVIYHYRLQLQPEVVFY